MTQFIREFLSLNPTGWTRGDVKTVLMARWRFARTLERNRSAYTNMLWTLIRRGDVEERDGKLYASDRVRRRVEALRRMELSEEAGVPARPPVGTGPQAPKRNG